MRSGRLRLLSALAGMAALATGTAAFAAAPSASGGSALSPELPASVIAASTAPGSKWKPENAVYGTTSQNDIPVTMTDGTVLRVNVTYPTDASGAPAKGPFPVLLTQTPYGKGGGGANSYLVKPVAFESLLEMVKALNLYWMTLSERPEVGNHEQVL